MTPVVRPGRLLAALAVVLVATLAPLGTATAWAENRAGVVIDTGDGAPRTICIRFDANTISGEEALRLAAAQDPSLAPVFADYGGMGKAVCNLCGIGGDGGDCFADPTQFWAYHQAAPGAGSFRQSPVGVSRTTVSDGAVEGYRYGGGAAPAFADIRTICGEVAPEPPPTTEAPAPPATEAPATTAPPATAPPATAAPGGTSPTTASGTAPTTTPTTTPPAGGAPEATTTTSTAAPTTTAAPSTTTSTTSAPPGDDDLVAVRSTDDGGGGGSPLALAGVGAVGIGMVAAAVGLRRARSRPEG